MVISVGFNSGDLLQRRLIAALPAKIRTVVVNQEVDPWNM
jgi:hypothetical protein